MKRHLIGWVPSTAVPLSFLMLVIAVLVAVLGSPSNERTAISFFINVVMVVGLQLFMGNSGVTNFGHVTFAGIAAYASALLTTPLAIKAVSIPEAPFGVVEIQLPILVAALLAVALSAVVGLLTGLVITRISGISATVTTLAMLIVYHSFLVNWESLTRGPRAFYGVPRGTTIWWSVACSIIVIVIACMFRGSRIGLRLRASSEDPVAAAASGVNVKHLRLLAWVASASIVGVAGVLQAHFFSAFTPDAFYFRAVFASLAMLLLGGMRSVSGAVVGTLFVTLGFEFVRYLENGPVVGGIDLPALLGLTELFMGGTIVTVMALRPDGIFGDRELDDVFRYLAHRTRRLRGRESRLVAHK